MQHSSGRLILFSFIKKQLYVDDIPVLTVSYCLEY